MRSRISILALARAFGLAVALSACGAAGATQSVPTALVPSPSASGNTGIRGVALAGPVCPVETVPPDPNCAPRMVPNAQIVVIDQAGTEVARVATDSEGAFFVTLPAGDYQVVPGSVEGLMGAAPPQDVHVKDGEVASIRLEYDTGIR